MLRQIWRWNRRAVWQRLQTRHWRLLPQIQQTLQSLVACVEQLWECTFVVANKIIRKSYIVIFMYFNFKIIFYYMFGCIDTFYHSYFLLRRHSKVLINFFSKCKFEWSIPDNHEHPVTAISYLNKHFSSPNLWLISSYSFLLLCVGDSSENMFLRW